ncbi:olfactory receptor 14I1-like [Calonectris borealis]|uniref:olfactory receptor 14I1-like n=1 Tax=Calonectris borealis TaxID=1323832 RepID=UPI003F4BFB5C
MSNGSSITQFLLLAFADTRELQLLHFWLFLGIYLAALLGNGLIITAIACDHRLHTPMYFFLLNLSLLDLGSISTTVPKAMANSLWDTRDISYAGCAAQVFFFLFLIAAEYCLLTVMAYDRYVAICNPLHYGTLLGSRACVHMAAAAWAICSRAGPPYFMVTTAKDDTGFHLPDQLFMVCKDLTQVPAVSGKRVKALLPLERETESPELLHREIKSTSITFVVLIGVCLTCSLLPAKGEYL